MTRERPPTARAGRCMHYNGSAHNDACAAGVNYIALAGGDKPGWFGRLPCLGGDHDTRDCAELRLPTAEEIDDWEAWSEWRTQMLAEAILRCVEASEAGRREGAVECPICDGEVRYSIASNGHMHGKCVTTKGCLGWMQ